MRSALRADRSDLVALTESVRLDPSLADAQDRKKGLLRNLDAADGLHPLLAGLQVALEGLVELGLRVVREAGDRDVADRSAAASGVGAGAAGAVETRSRARRRF